MSLLLFLATEPLFSRDQEKSPSSSLWAVWAGPAKPEPSKPLWETRRVFQAAVGGVGAACLSPPRP